MTRSVRRTPEHRLNVDNVRERLDSLNLAATEVSTRIGMNRSWMQNILNGRNADAAGGAILELAKIFQCDPSYLYGKTGGQPGESATPAPVAASSSTAKPLPSDRTRQATVVGRAQAGAWLEVDEFYEPTEFVTIDVPDGFENARFPVFDVVGDSMDEGGILDGDRIICWDIHDYPFPLREGDDVVVERRRAEGLLREWTVKRIFYHQDGTKELRPISSNSAHKSFRILPGEDGPENVIQIIAVVDRIIRPHRRRIGA